MMFNQPFFSIAPETFQAVDVDFAGREDLFVVDPEMAITAEHQSIITSELIGIDYTPSTHFFDRQIQKGLGTDVGQNLHLNNSLSLQDAENRDFVTSTSSTFAFTLTSKIGFVHLHFSFDQSPAKGGAFSNYAPSNQIHCLQHCRITYTHLFGNLPGGKLQLKQLDDPEPVNGIYLQLTQPPPSPFKKCIAASLTTKTTIRKSIDFIALTPYAVPPKAGFHNRFAKKRLAVFSFLTIR
jgi:hypothetical protein